MPWRSSNAPIATLVRHIRIFPDVVLGLFLLTAIAAFLYGLTLIQSHPLWGSVVALGSSVSIIGLIATFFFKVQIRVNVVVLLLASFISLHGLELFLTYYDLLPEGVPHYITTHSDQVKEAAAQAGVELDPRRQYDIIYALNDDGYLAYPGGLRTFVMDSYRPPPGQIHPLGYSSFASIVSCKEAGPWVTYKSDKYGFNNSVEIYDNETLHAVTIGDSFTNGVCVEPEDNVAGWLGRNGYSTVNLGITGTGSLHHLAVLREYASRMSPKVVLWMYVPNDPDDLMLEYNVPALRRYLDPNFSQDLINRQTEIDELYWSLFWESGLSEVHRADLDQGRRVVQRQEPKPRGAPDESKLRSVKAKLTFYEIRRVAGLTRSRISPLQRGREFWERSSLDMETFQRFQAILEIARDETAGFGGKLYFVYLPIYQDVVHGPGEDRDVVLSIVDSLEIPLIDYYPRLTAHADPLSLFPFRLNGHYNAEGYKGLAELIIEKAFEGQAN